MSRKSKRPQTPPAGAARKSTGAPIWIATLCFAGAAGVAAWLLLYSISQKPLAGCGPGSPCDRVMGSSWAYWLEIPVSAPALVAYVSLFLSSLMIASGSARSSKPWHVGFFFSVLVIAAASWFVYLQLGVIKSVCKFCTAAHLLSVTGSILFLLKAPKPALIQPRLRWGLGFAALVAFGSVVAGQKFAPHRTNIVSIYNGTLRFDVREAPILGSAENGRYMVSLFDYTCPDCHEMHALLKAARERLTNSFSIISLPVPLDANCNPGIRVTRDKHKDACEYARIGMAMRKAGADLFAKYDEWFFGHQGKIPTLEDARSQARTLAGPAAFEKALADPWVNEMIRQGISIYDKNGAATRSYRLPQIVVGDTVNIGPVANLDELLNLLQKRLPPPKL